MTAISNLAKYTEAYRDPTHISRPSLLKAKYCKCIISAKLSRVQTLLASHSAGFRHVKLNLLEQLQPILL